MLEGVRGGKPEDLLGVSCLEHFPAEGCVQLGFAQVGQHVHRPGDLRGGRGPGGTGHPEGPHEGEVQQDVHHAGGHHSPQRRFGVAAAHDALLRQVVEHQEGQPDEVHPPIEDGFGQNLFRRADEPQQSGQGEKAQRRQPQCQRKVHKEQVIEQLGHFLPGGRGLARCHQQTAAQLHAAGDEEEDHQHRGGVGHSRQRVGVQPQPDDHGIGHRVELCGHHAQDDRKSIPQQRRAHRPMQQGVLCFVRAEHLLSGNHNIHRMY